MNSKAKNLIKNTAIYGAIIGVSAFLFFGVLKIATVSGNSMNDTYFDGDKLLCLRHAEPEKGDVIITDCDAGIVLIKRVIATEGDTVDIDFDSGAVKVNGETLEDQIQAKVICEIPFF